jgi:hypothetical protein
VVAVVLDEVDLHGVGKSKREKLSAAGRGHFH